VVISRDFSSGTFEMWQEKVLGSDKVRSDAQMLSSNGEVAGSVSNNKYAIGYVGLGYAKDSVKGLQVNGVTASVVTAKDDSYALARELYMFTKGEPAGAVKRFIDFVKSKQGQSIVEEEGFVAID
jgi:phosphate transport system substrate-binding protein